VTLTDAGPLVALIDAGNPDHARCREALDQVRLPLLSTWPAFTKAMALLTGVGDERGPRAVWQFLLRDHLVLAQLSDAAIARAARLMELNADRGIDLADATLVALAEERELSRIFTLNGAFRNYRLNGRGRFEVVPEAGQPASAR
jgi:predicted nucleic acid-binding protein